MSISNLYRLAAALPLACLVLLLAYLVPNTAFALGDGIRVSIEESEVDWSFDSGTREARITRLGFEYEERLDTGSLLGFGLGYSDISLRREGNNPSKSLTGEYLELFLRHPFELSDNLSLLTRFNYRYNTADGTDDDETADIDWSEISLATGLALRFSHFRFTPFARFHYLDGDFDSDTGGGTFDIDDPASVGVRLDYFTEPTAYVRLTVESGDYSGIYFTFAREY